MLLHRLLFSNDAATNPLLFLSARPFVSVPDAFQPAYRLSAPRPTLTSPLTLAGTRASLINLHSVCRFAELCEEIMFNKWLLFKMRSNSRETCCMRLYCFSLMHGAFAAALIYLCNGCSQKRVQNAPHILLKMSQGSTACLGFVFPRVAAAEADVPAAACQKRGGGCIRVSFRRIR